MKFIGILKDVFVTLFEITVIALKAPFVWLIDQGTLESNFVEVEKAIATQEGVFIPGAIGTKYLLKATNKKTKEQIMAKVEREVNLFHMHPKRHIFYNRSKKVFKVIITRYYVEEEDLEYRN